MKVFYRGAVFVAVLMGVGATLCAQPSKKTTKLSPPELAQPKNNGTIDVRGPINFSWLPPTPLTWQTVRYRLRIVEVVRQQTPETAIEANEPFYSSGAVASVLTYPATAPTFEVGHRYAWQVTAIFNDQAPSISSKIGAFTAIKGETLASDGNSRQTSDGAMNESEDMATSARSITPMTPLGSCDGNATQDILSTSTRVVFSAEGSFNSFTAIIYDNPCGAYPQPTNTSAVKEKTPTILTWPIEGSPRVKEPVMATLGNAGAGSGSGKQQYSMQISLSSTLQPGQAFVYQIAGTYVDVTGGSHTVLSQPQCIRYRPIDPTTSEPAAPINCP